MHSGNDMASHIVVEVEEICRKVQQNKLKYTRRVERSLRSVILKFHQHIYEAVGLCGAASRMMVVMEI